MKLHMTKLCVAVPLVLLVLQSRASQDSCPPGWIEVAREKSGDETTIYCGRPEDKPRLERVTKAITAAATAPECVGAVACNFFVGKIGKLLDIPYFRDILRDKSEDGRMANEIFKFVEKAIASPPSGWKALTPEDAQRWANRGRFVIGVARSKHPHDHGHIVIVAPSPMDHADQPGSGPWVRDSQNPNVSVRASKRFGSTVVEPIWAIWNY